MSKHKEINWGLVGAYLLIGSIVAYIVVCMFIVGGAPAHDFPLKIAAGCIIGYFIISVASILVAIYLLACSCVKVSNHLSQVSREREQKAELQREQDAFTEEKIHDAGAELKPRRSNQYFLDPYK